MEGAKTMKMPGNLHQSVKNAFYIFLVTNGRNGFLFVEAKIRNCIASINCQVRAVYTCGRRCHTAVYRIHETILIFKSLKRYFSYPENQL